MKEFTLLGCLETGAGSFTPICWYIQANNFVSAHRQALDEIAIQVAKDNSPGEDFSEDYIHINFILEGHHHHIHCVDAESCCNIQDVLDGSPGGDLCEEEPMANG